MSKSRRAYAKKGLVLHAVDVVGDEGLVSPRAHFENEDVYFLLTLTIGMADEEGSSLFYANVATPEALRKRAPQGPAVVSKRAMLIVSEFDWRTLDEELRSIVKACEAQAWPDAKDKLLRYFRWEYEDTDDRARALVASQS
jgi:hypothetical protein